MEYSKPVYFRPSEMDAKILELIAGQRPAFAGSATDLLRIALENYWFEHEPNSKRSKGARIDRLEKKMDLVLSRLGIEFVEVA